MKQRNPRTETRSVLSPAVKPVLAEKASVFVRLEREVEAEFRPQMLAALQEKVTAMAESSATVVPCCQRCGKPMGHQDTRRVSWWARSGRLSAAVRRYRCWACGWECRPLLELLEVEPGRISGSLARLLAILAVVAPYPLAAQLAERLLGVVISPMGIWRVVQRLGEAATRYREALSEYHYDSRSLEVRAKDTPAAVVLAVDGCALGMQVRQHRRRQRTGEAPLPPLPKVEEGQFREVKTGVLLLPSERVETTPGRRGLVRRFLVSCLGDADTIFRHLWAQLCELGWLGANTVVVIVGDGADWIWNRAALYPRRCEILDFWHAVEHAWEFARLRFGEGSQQADRWVQRIAEDLKAGQVKAVIARLGRLHPSTSEQRASLRGLIGYYRENARRMRYDEYLRLGYGIGSGAVESAHKQVVHARMRQAGMRWSEAGARRLLALRLLLLNQHWSQLDQLRMVAA